MPDIGARVPDIDDRVPDIGDRVPEIGDRVPDIGGHVPGVGDRVPEIGDRVPDIGGHVPGIGGRVPDLLSAAREQMMPYPGQMSAYRDGIVLKHNGFVGDTGFMTRAIAVVFALCSIGLLADTPATPDLSGTWTLDRTISVDPSKITLMPTANTNGSQSQRRGGGGHRGGYGGYGGGGYSGSSNRNNSNGARSLSLVEQQRLKAVTDELRTASTSLVISQQGSKVVVQDALKRSQTFPTDGSKATNNLADNVIESTTRWDNGHLVTECPVADRLTLVYTYTLLPATNQLVMRVNRKDGENLRPFDPDVKFVYVRAKS